MTASAESILSAAAWVLGGGYYALAAALCEAELASNPDNVEARRLLSIVRDRTRLFEAGSPLLAYRANATSQNGEDGVLAEILMRLDIKSGWFCEFGAWDGIHYSNSFSLIDKGWRGVYIEGDPEKYQDLLKTCDRFSKGTLFPILAYVHHSDPEYTVDALLSKTPIPSDFDVLSIDIDSSDYQIWESIQNYKPKIVIVEVNSAIAPPVVAIHGDGVVGSSFQAMVNLAKSKGYTPVCHTGNLIAVRDDLVGNLGLPDSVIQNPATLFLTNWAGSSLLGR